MQKGMFSNKNKKAQLTIFIVLAIIIVVGIGIWFFAVSDTGKSMLGGGFGDDVKTSIEQCIQDSTLQGIYSIGLQGGYYDSVTNSIDYNTLKIPIYVNAKIISIPSQTKIEQELGKAIEKNFAFCLSDVVSSYTERGYEISAGEAGTVKASMVKKQIKVEVNRPISIKKGDSSIILSEFSKIVDFDLAGKYNLTKAFADEQAKTPSESPMSYLIDLGINNNFDIETIDIDSKTTIHTFIFNESYNNQKFIYAFAVKYA